jgi:hypothetical protein
MSLLGGRDGTRRHPVRHARRRLDRSGREIHVRLCLLVDGDPLASIDLLGDPAKNFVVMMKDKKAYSCSLRP